MRVGEWIFLSALFCCGTTASATNLNQWMSLGPEGGIVQKLLFSPTPQKIFAQSNTALYVSTDGGASWRRTSLSAGGSLGQTALDPADATRVYVTADGLLYISSDAGSTFTQTPVPVNNVSPYAIGVSHDGATLYVGSGAGAAIASSADRGQTWHAKTSPGPAGTVIIWKLVVDPTSASTVYALTADGTGNTTLSVSTNGAASWTSLVTAPVSDYIYDVVLNVSVTPHRLWTPRSDGIFTSGDGGTTWSNSLASPVATLTLDPNAPATIYAGDGWGKVYKSTDNGASWSDTTGGQGAGQVFSLVVDPTSSAHVLIGGKSGIAASSDAGAHWSMQQSGFVAADIAGFSADPATDRIYFLQPSVGLFYESAGVANALPANNAPLLAAQGVNSLYVSSFLATHGTVYASTPPALFYSTDGGNSWASEVVNPVGPNQLFAMASPASNPQVIVGAGAVSLFDTVNQGALWNKVGGLPAGSTLSNVFFGPTGAAYGTLIDGAGTAGSYGPYSSIDNGVTWAAIGASSPVRYLLAVDPLTPGVLYGVDSQGSRILRSPDNGGSWTATQYVLPSGDGGLGRMAIDPVHPAILYASSVTAVSRSVDSGASWQIITPRPGIADTWPSGGLIVDPNRPENVLYATLNAGVQQITIAPDLSLKASAPAVVPVNAAGSFTYTVANLGPFDATGVVVSLTLPAGAKNVSGTISTGNACAVALPSVTCAIGIVHTAASATVTLSAASASPGAFAVSAHVSGDQPDSNAANNSASNSTTVQVQSDLALSISGPATAKVGDAVSYTVTAKNNGPNDAPGVTVTDQLTSGLTLGTITANGATCTGGSGAVSCTLSTVASGASVSIVINATVASAGAQASSASVTTTATDPVSGNNAASTSTSVASQSSGGGGGGLGWSECALLAACSMFAVGRRRSA